MPTEVWVSLLVAVAINAAAVGVSFGSVRARLKAVEDKLNSLEKKQDKHNNFIERLCRLEGQVQEINDREE